MLASPDDVETRLGRPLTVEETERVDGLIAEASALVAGWLCRTPDPVPGEVAIVTSRMVARALTPPAGADPGVTNTSATMGPFAYTRAYSPEASSGGVWLTRQDKTILRRFARRGAVRSVAT